MLADGRGVDSGKALAGCSGKGVGKPGGGAKPHGSEESRTCSKFINEDSSWNAAASAFSCKSSRMANGVSDTTAVRLALPG
eukprot:CAMPEP_0115270150 /NCGR_PEP_ID=MMETSP0270-20121206/53418_1 /TAXON_ID=71861 /ORGANISM="Scrippsiella trochoidea, Strain CCMP3099" /LENGTH=80 /DNA_ID=CAMNT_0002686435 /DNA_START=653 /DNA_END=895 /DNA_ORIENTATION=-